MFAFGRRRRRRRKKRRRRGKLFTDIDEKERVV